MWAVRPYFNEVQSETFTLLFTGWTQVQRNMYIDADLESSPLEIKTDSSLGSDEIVDVNFSTSGGFSAGGVILHFTSTPQYQIKRCTISRTNFPTELPTDMEEKVWKITLTKTTGIVILCNGKEVLNFPFSHSTCEDYDWDRVWRMKDVRNIRFDDLDTASDYYRGNFINKTTLIIKLNLSNGQTQQDKRSFP